MLQVVGILAFLLWIMGCSYVVGEYLVQICAKSKLCICELVLTLAKQIVLCTSPKSNMNILCKT